MKMQNKNIRTPDMDSKTDRILEKNNIKPPVEGRCGYFVKRKQRYCKMLPAKGNIFCAEHLQFANDEDVEKKRKRIPCPLDPKHSVFEDKIKAHLKKCNATRKIQLPYYEENVNLGIRSYQRSPEEQLVLSQTPIEELNVLIKKLREIHREMKCLMETTEENNNIHDVLKKELEIHDESSSNIKKHLLQQGSLVHILDNAGSLHDDVNVIEFGAGRGTLSHWVQKAMCNKKGCKFFLVDRQHNRNKLDCYHKGEDQGPNFQRLNIDIQHLNLDKVDCLKNDSSDIIAIGKHLCGGATDLSLRCLLHNNTLVKENKSSEVEEPLMKRPKTADIKDRLHSVLFALCCYHRCTWDTYIGTEFLTKLDITPKDFHRMVKMATWSTCGFERRTNENDFATENNFENEHTTGKQDASVNEVDKRKEDEKLHVQLGLSAKDQEDIGRLCKQIIDYGRIEYIKNHGLQAKLIQYVQQDITPENIALLVTKLNDVE